MSEDSRKSGAGRRLDAVTAVRLAKRYGVPTADVQELAAKCGGDPRAVEAALRACTEVGINHRGIGESAFYAHGDDVPGKDS